VYNVRMLSPVQLSADTGLVGHISNQLAMAIIKGELEEGAKLSEEQLAQAFGISRTPVREAIRVLARDGLVQLAPRRGARVISFTPKWTADVYLCRAYLQGLAAKLATNRVTWADLEACRTWLAEMRSAAESQDAHAHFTAVVAWHSLLSERAGNEPLEAMMTSLGRRIQRLRYVAAQIPGQIARSAVRHAELYDALETRDGLAAERAVRLTIAEAGEAVMEHHFGISKEQLAAPPFGLRQIIDT